MELKCRLTHNMAEIEVDETEVQNNYSDQDQSGNISKLLFSEVFLLTNGFVKTKGQFGEYFLHEKHQLFRCWFHNGELQVGKKDVEKDICFWIATLDDRNDFSELFRILTKDTICNFNI